MMRIGRGKHFIEEISSELHLNIRTTFSNIPRSENLFSRLLSEAKEVEFRWENTSERDLEIRHHPLHYLEHYLDTTGRHYIEQDFNPPHYP